MHFIFDLTASYFSCLKLCETKHIVGNNDQRHLSGLNSGALLYSAAVYMRRGLLEFSDDPAERNELLSVLENAFTSAENKTAVPANVCHCEKVLKSFPQLVNLSEPFHMFNIFENSMFDNRVFWFPREVYADGLFVVVNKGSSEVRFYTKHYLEFQSILNSA